MNRPIPDISYRRILNVSWSGVYDFLEVCLMTVLVLFIIVIILTVAQYCQSRDHTSMPENVWDCDELKKKEANKQKKKPTERDANWWPAKCLPNMNQWLISCRYPQGDGFFLVWCSTFCAKSQHKHHSGGKKKEKSVQVLDILPKKRSVSLVHANLLVEWRRPKEMKGSNSFGVST